MLTLPDWRSLYRRRAVAALPGYSGGSFFSRYRPLMLALLIAVTVAVGVVIGMTGHRHVMAFAGVAAILALLIIWALPEIYAPPLKIVSFLFFSYMVALLVWPDYLALALPGLPWLTAIRLIGAPLALFFLVSLSVSRVLRQEMAAIMKGTLHSSRLLVAFILISVLSIAFSADRGFSIDRMITSLINWHLIFFVACWVFVSPSRVKLFVYMIWGFAVIACLVGLQEARVGGVIWANSIPSFLTIEDPNVQRILAGASRAAIGIHRVQGKFTTPLGLAEFLALAMPFVIFVVAYGQNIVLRILAVLTVPIIFHVITLTDSRLGFVGFCLSFLLFSAAWALLRWKNVKGGIVGPAITLAFPVIFLVFIIATFAVGRLRNRVWGTGAHSFSTEAREIQIAEGIPMVLSQPWGHGMAMGAETLGFRNLAGTITIDNYFLSIALEFGIIGFFVYFGIFVAQIIYAGSGLRKYDHKDALVLIPAGIALINFVVIKSILSQQENHGFVFAIVGLIAGVLHGLKRDHSQTQPGVSAEKY